MMPHPSWNESYASGQVPWDTGQPEPLLVEFVTSGAVMPSPALEIGAGTGTNAIWMGGLWLSLIGSTEGPPREFGPPRRSAREIALAIEPALEIVELRSAEFHGANANAWFCLSRQRAMPLQPSTLHD